MPPKGLLQKHRNTQGLVNPGKVTKRRSNHSLHDTAVQANGNANIDATPPPPPPITQHSNGTVPSPANGEDTSQSATPPAAKSSPDTSLGDNPSAQQPFPPAPLAMDINKVAAGSRNVLTGSVVRQVTTTAATILTSCPQRDVIAMLILLLQLSPPLLFAVDFLYVVMTTNLSKLSTTAFLMPSFHTLFEGVGGSPSIATIVMIDVLFFGLWVFIPSPVKNIGLDLAQAVIALSFSGGYTNTQGTTNSALICLATITLFRTLSHRTTRQYGWQILWTKLLRQPSDLQLPPDPGGAVPFLFLDRPSLPRTIVGVHILAQGVLKVIRRSVLAARDNSNSSQLGSIKKVDPDAVLFDKLHRSNSMLSEKGADAGVSPTDTRAPSTLPFASEAIDRAIAGKRKKKQATIVRSLQPFWAACAHTKVTISNNMQQNSLVGDASEARATGINHIGNANFLSTGTNQVWITRVEASQIGFGIVLAAEEAEQSNSEQDCEQSASLDKSAPFYVRVNGANWGSTRLARYDGPGSQHVEQHIWRGEIFGLTPISNYVCEFVRTSDDITIRKLSLITQPAPYTEQAPAPVHQALRPSSPTTTLKNSIAAAESRLHDQRNKLKRNRKDHKAATTTIKKEVDRLSSSLATAGGQDERLKQRANQLKQTIKQAGEATTAADAEVRDLGEIPMDEVDEHRARKRSWQKQLDVQNAKRSDIDSAKTHQARECSHVEGEISSAVQKRERLQLRQAKLNEQHDRLVRANAQDADEKQQRLAKRQVDAISRANLEQQYIFNIQEFETKTQETRARTVQTVNQSQHLEGLMLQQANHQASYDQGHSPSPTTPEGPLPGTGNVTFASPGNRNSLGAFNTAFQFPAFDNGFSDSPHPMPAIPMNSAYNTTHHGRSSSMLSGVSGFTDDLDETPNLNPGFGAIGSPAPTNGSGHAHVNGNGTGYSPYGRKHSGGSGSGSGSGATDGTGGSASIEGSQRDPMSPPPKAASVSPIGLKSKPSQSPGPPRY